MIISVIGIICCSR